ncbi:MAG TPA: restriction endonuclease subunit S [Adlercreutzia equolifaciens]|uniref:restriction endonuclease subunit S n=1 Tax=Adlercreutzia equolifaciens TaxID=446660 RepID=UPI00242CA021|nr:restriction endonuclease subunit S [Adlercreutzia equolifaciens]HJI12315.1 restriction endonuclease subunit S [Adlercreutzia equolifaciens]
MEEKRNVPKLRFPGFTDPWEQRRLGELVEETYGGGTPKTSVPEYWGGDIPWIQSSNVIEGELFNIDIPKAITDKGLRESAAILIPGSSIAVVTHVGVGKLVYLPFSFTTSQDFVSLSRLKTNSIFLCYALFRRLQTEINMVQGSAIKGITKAELLDKRIDIPHDVEQTQIGAFLQKLDSLIALHQRELDHVKELKKGLLQKMFPKEGTNVPELRFPGFTDPWEQRRLGELMDITSVKRVHQDDWSSEGIRFLRARDLVAFSNGEEIDEPLFISEELYEEYSSLSGKAVENDLLVTGVGTIGVPWRVPSSEPIYFKDGNIIWFKNMNVIDGLFFYYSFTSSSIQDFIRKSAGSGTVGTFTIDTGKKTPIQLPSIDEQAQIGGFFQRLDSLIALHQRELDHVKELKKGLLQQMFV